MMRVLLWSIILSCTLPSISSRPSRVKTLSEEIECEIQEVDVELANHSRVFSDQETGDFETDPGTYVCVTNRNNVQDQSFTINIPPEAIPVIKRHKSPVMTISNAVVSTEHAKITIPTSSPVDISITESRGTRRLAQKQGISDVLVLRVTYRGKAPSISANTLMGSVFGLGKNPPEHSMSSQFDACSFGKLKMRPASGAGISNGVAEISIETKVSGGDEVLALDNAVVEKANEMFGRLKSNFDHVVVVLPGGLKYQGNYWLAYGYLNGWRSVYNDVWSGSLSALMHETGHNLDLHHSGMGKYHYGDVSGYMGWGTTRSGWPTSCFNAQKSYDLGWYDDRLLRLGLEDLPWGGHLAFFGEYNLTNAKLPVLINFGERNDRIFMLYNRAKGMNAQTRAYPNQVVIVGDKGDTTRWGEQSWFEGAIGHNAESINRNYRVKNFEGTESTLFIRVCQEFDGPPDFVRLSIHLNDGTQRDTCNDDIDSPYELCDDDMAGAFFVDDRRGYKDCGWLIRVMQINPSWFDQLCLKGQSARDVCPETCNKCSDDCEDQEGKLFYVSSSHGHKNCEWLSSRSPWIQKLCVPGNDAYQFCEETCNVCDYAS